YAIPEAWTPGTQGPVRGPVLKVKIESAKDLDQYKGKLAGKILLLDDPFEVKEPEGSDYKRYTAAELEDLAKFEARPDRGDYRSPASKRGELAKSMAEFLAAEKALATISVSPRESGVVRVSSRPLWEKGSPNGVPSLVMASEPYDTILRLVADDRPVELEIDV